MRAIILGLTLWLAASPAHATPPAQALYGTINSTPVAIYAGNSFLGICIIGEAQVAPDSWSPIFSIQCDPTPPLAAHGGAAGYISWLLPDINLRLKSYFGGGTDVEAQLDDALNTSFKFVGNQLAPK